MPRHVVRLVVVVAVCAFLALFAKSYFTKDSFYRFGHYRADSVRELASMAPAFQTPKACVSCHVLRHAEWKEKAHQAVICEVCHNAAAGHPEGGNVTIPADTNTLCTQCHEQMPGRPVSAVRQIAPNHPTSPQCISCHNPHAPKVEPLIAASAVNVRAGQTASAVCAGCHGATGVSVNPEWPNLAGQNAAFLTRELASFQVGARKSDTMGPLAQSLTAEQIVQLATFFSTQACKADFTRVPAAQLAAGEQLAKSCAACHGERGRGTSNVSLPRLAGQNAAYLNVEIGHFKAGDRNSPIMNAVARDLADADIEAVSRYYALQSCGIASR